MTRPVTNSAYCGAPHRPTKQAFHIDSGAHSPQREKFRDADAAPSTSRRSRSARAALLRRRRAWSRLRPSTRSVAARRGILLDVEFVQEAVEDRREDDAGGDHDDKPAV